MNFVEGRCEAGSFVSTDLHLALPASRWPAPPAGPVALGIRPDQLRVRPGAADGTAVAATIRAIERLGDRMDVVLQRGGTRLTARVENDDRLVEGEQAAVTVDLSAAHLFAPGEDGARIPDANDRG
jgi:multiple sugar transport system ATP-binding protein